MADLSDLPLFAWKRPCMLIAFPTTRRVGAVRDAADALEMRRGKARDVHWARIVAKLRRDLFEIGYSDEKADALVSDFHGAVEAEFLRRAFQAATRDDMPGGAA